MKTTANVLYIGDSYVASLEELKQLVEKANSDDGLKGEIRTLFMDDVLTQWLREGDDAEKRIASKVTEIPKTDNVSEILNSLALAITEKEMDFSQGIDSYLEPIGGYFVDWVKGKEVDLSKSVGYLDGNEVTLSLYFRYKCIKVEKEKFIFKLMCGDNIVGKVQTIDMLSLREDEPCNIIFENISIPAKTKKMDFQLYVSGTRVKTISFTELSSVKIDVKGVSFDMVWVGGGTFQMGSNDGDDAEKPMHSVTLDGYYIGKTQVTQTQWQAVMGSKPSNFKGGNNPVEGVSWGDSQEFVKKLSSLTGRRFSLPTEAQWEYAARGGSKSRGYKYSGSNDIDSVAWYGGNSGNVTHPVANKKPNELGIYDMNGNVCEWCQDWYDKDYYANSPTRNPLNNVKASDRVCRGGCYFSYASRCRSANRDFDNPGHELSRLGLRLVLLP